MKKLTPKGIIGLSTTAFLFLILMSIIYLNNQVEFNPIEAKWELQEQYQVGLNITSGSISSSSIENYNMNYVVNEVYIPWDGILDDDEFGRSRTDIKEIQNNNILLSDIVNLNGVIFWDSNMNYIGVYYPSHSTRYINFGGFIAYILEQDLEIPFNAQYFALIANTGSSIPGFPATTFQLFSSIEATYLSIDYEFIYEPQDTYQVFENIRNNATTVNPLGFMNTLVSIPSQAVGYFKSFTQFLSFDIADGIQTWWRDNLLGPESGYWSLVELIQDLGE